MLLFVVSLFGTAVPSGRPSRADTGQRYAPALCLIYEWNLGHSDKMEVATSPQFRSTVEVLWGSVSRAYLNYIDHWPLTIEHGPLTIDHESCTDLIIVHIHKKRRIAAHPTSLYWGPEKTLTHRYSDTTILRYRIGEVTMFHLVCYWNFPDFEWQDEAFASHLFSTKRAMRPLPLTARKPFVQRPRARNPCVFDLRIVHKSGTKLRTYFDIAKGKRWKVT